MIIDAHVHLFPPEVTADIDRYTSRDSFLKEICSSPRNKFAGMEDLLAEMDRCGIQMAAAGGFACSDHGLCRAMNDYVLEANRQYPGRLLPLAVVVPNRPDLEAEIARSQELGAVGVGELFPWGQRFDLTSPEAGRLAALCAERKLPLLLHVNEEVGHSYSGKGPVSVKQAAEFALMYPDLTIIYAHWGGGLLFYELMPELHRSLKNVYYDTAAGPFLYRPDIYRVAREIGVLHKILLGSDYPLLSPRRYLKQIQEAGLEEEEVRAILGGNAGRVFNLPCGPDITPI